MVNIGRDIPDVLGVAEKMPLYTVHNLPHRAQVMTTFQNDISLKMLQGTVLHFRNNINFPRSKWMGKLREFLEFSFSRRIENVLRFHEFSRTARSTKTEKLA